MFSALFDMLWIMLLHVLAVVLGSAVSRGIDCGCGINEVKERHRYEGMIFQLMPII